MLILVIMAVLVGMVMLVAFLGWAWRSVFRVSMGLDMVMVVVYLCVIAGKWVAAFFFFLVSVCVEKIKLIVYTWDGICCDDSRSSIRDGHGVHDEDK